MQINHVQSAAPALEKLTSSNLSQADKLHEVSRQFEAILLRQVLSEAQKPVFKSKMNNQGVAGDIYRDVITQETAEQISRSGSLGLAKGLETQLQRQLKTDEKPAPGTPNQPAPGCQCGCQSKRNV